MPILPLRHPLRAPAAALALAFAVGCEPPEGVELIEQAVVSPAAVLTQHNDNARTGATLVETTLRPSNVNKATFGRVNSLPVRGSINAQPLVIPDFLVTGGIVVVATMHNLVYAFRADGSSTTPVWGPISLGPSINLPDAETGPGGYRDIAGEVGIVSTPVASPDLNALFVVAVTKTGTSYQHKLHRLNLSTGAVVGTPVTIAASGFDSRRQMQRPGLLLTGSRLYMAFGSYGDRTPYQGWIFSYDVNLTTSSQKVFRTTGSDKGGIWMAGAGPASDGTSVWALTGNGAFSPPAAQSLPAGSAVDLGDSFFKLGANDLALKGWFSPSDNEHLNRQDGDLGSSGPMLIPGSNLVVAAGKEGRVFVLDRGMMGGFQNLNQSEPVSDLSQTNADTQILQRFFVNGSRCNALAGSSCWHVHGSPVFWKGPTDSLMYVWPENDNVRAFRFDTATQRFDCRGATQPNCNSRLTGNTTEPEGVAGGSAGMPGGFLSLSANGNTAGTGILWATHPWSGNANQQVVEGVMRAFDASSLGTNLWSSKQDPRDDLGPFAKSVPPTVARGRVYAATGAFLTGKITLGESSNVGPALAAGPAGKMFLAWTGTDSRLNLLSTTAVNLSSTPNANAPTGGFTDKITLGDSSNLAPGLASDSNVIYLGWIGTDSAHHINVARATNPSPGAPSGGFTKMQELVNGSPVFPLTDTSDAGLALAVGGGRVYVAWKGFGSDRRINVMSALTGATTFVQADKVVLAETTAVAPTLTFVEGTLFLTWIGTDQHINIAPLTNNGRTLGTKVTLDETSNVGATLAGLRSAGAIAADLHLFWSGTDAAASLNVKSADDAHTDAFRFKLTFGDQSQVAPWATVFQKRVYVAFRGNDADHRLNVARYNPGELALYGLR